MASFMRRAMVYLGLQDDDEHHYDQFNGYPEYPAEDHDDTGEQGYGREPYRSQYEPRPQPQETDRSGDIRELRPAPEPYGKEPTVRTIPRDEPPSAVTVSPGVMRSATSARVHVVEPHGFNDAQELGDRLKANQPVIMNLQGVPRELQRRLIDFSSGLAYGVGGSMSRVADQVFLLTPTNVEVSQEEKERLQARGLYHG
jgi:cell division inhibitor SepF